MLFWPHCKPMLFRSNSTTLPINAYCSCEDSPDPDIGNWLRQNNPDPYYKKNHHQWLKEFGREQVDRQITKVVTIMKLCRDMNDFKAKFAHVFKNSPLQLTFDDINWTAS